MPGKRVQGLEIEISGWGQHSLVVEVLNFRVGDDDLLACGALMWCRPEGEELVHHISAPHARSWCGKELVHHRLIGQFHAPTLEGIGDGMNQPTLIRPSHCRKSANSRRLRASS